MKLLAVAIAFLIMAVPALAQDASAASRIKFNRLAGEASPYLRQHAMNPVDWYPWGEEAFAKARAENKPIFLSVGYATCHWCHVMARESFESEEVAGLLNTNVVSIKVDRERHPEVDATYMLATELISGRGGWPNSVFLTPDLKPFFAATYLPPDHFKRVLTTIGATWRGDAQSLKADGEKVAAIIERIMRQRVAAVSLTPEVLGATAAKLLEQFDSFHGGLGTAPKFPREPVWRGEIQGPALGMAVEVFDERGVPLLPGNAGELVCTAPFPSMPIGFWNDPHNANYRAAYFDRFPGAWRHGDWIERTWHGAFMIHGRSDATLNPGGVRIGTAEIYRQVEAFEEVLEALVVGQAWDNDTRVVLFVVLRPELVLDSELHGRIAKSIRSNCTPRHVPARIIQVRDIPRTRSNKISELAVRDMIHGRPVKNREALANPDTLELFRNLPELQA